MRLTARSLRPATERTQPVLGSVAVDEDQATVFACLAGRQEVAAKDRTQHKGDLLERRPVDAVLERERLQPLPGLAPAGPVEGKEGLSSASSAKADSTLVAPTQRAKVNSPSRRSSASRSANSETATTHCRAVNVLLLETHGATSLRPLT